MGILDETRSLERQQFFNGQRLFAADLQGLEAFSREMRWLHNRSLHQPGIGNGYAVFGKKGDRQITIGPGYAIDDLGREIVLTETRVEPVPPVSGEEDGSPVFYDLTVSYPDDNQLEEVETRAGICQTQGVVRLREEPVFSWVRLEKDSRGNLKPNEPMLVNDIKDGRKIIVARVEVLNCQMNDAPSIAQRRLARPAKQPYIACGSEEPTEWKFFDVVEEAPDSVSVTGELSVLPFGLKADIHTDNAGFATTPCYSVRIQGSRVKQLPTTNGNGNLGDCIVDGLVNIVTSQPHSFTVEVLVLAQTLLDSLDTQMSRDPTVFSDWQVVWMGVEG